MDFSTRSIECCTIFKLIQAFTNHNAYCNPDYDLIRMFLFSYHSFFTPQELFELLIFRSFAFPSDPAEKDAWSEHLVVITQRILKILTFWVDRLYYTDFADSEKMMYLLAHFVALHQSYPGCKMLLVKLGQTMARSSIPQTPRKPHKLLTLLKNDNSSSSDSKLLTTRSILDFEPSDLARQMAIIDYEIFKNIHPLEYANQNWCSTAKGTRAPNILRMVTHFNKVSNWIASEILKVQPLKERAVILNRFIIIAEESRALRNYNGTMAILSGLQSAPIYRLKKTWSLLPSKTWDIWDGLNSLMGNQKNFSSYRETLSKADPPCVPYIGIFLTDLVVADAAQEDFKQGTQMINIKKIRVVEVSKYFLDKFRWESYRITHVQPLQEFLRLTNHFEEDEQKSLSLQLEA